MCDTYTREDLEGLRERFDRIREKDSKLTTLGVVKAAESPDAYVKGFKDGLDCAKEGIADLLGETNSEELTPFEAMQILVMDVLEAVLARSDRD